LGVQEGGKRLYFQKDATGKKGGKKTLAVPLTVQWRTKTESKGPECGGKDRWGTADGLFRRGEK